MTNELVKDLFRQAIDQKYEFLNDGKEIEFSDSFTCKMEKLIKRQSGTIWYMFNSVGKKVAVIIIGIIIAFTGSLSVKAVREGVVELVKEIYEKYISITFDGNTFPVIETEYIISYVPDGFEQTIHDKNDAQVLSEYVNDKGDIITVLQAISDGTIIKIDNEHLKNSTVVINNNEVQIGISNGYMVAVWTENAYVFRIEFIGEYNLEEAEKIISSVVIE